MWSVCQLVHLSDQAIDEILSISMVAAFNKVCCFLSVSTTSAAQFKWPYKVIGFLEVLSNGKDLMDEVFHTNDAIPTKAFFNDGIVTECSSSLVNFTKSSFVDQLSYALQIRIPTLIDNKHVDTSFQNGGSFYIPLCGRTKGKKTGSKW